MQIEKYKIQEYNKSLLAEHKRKFDFVAAGISNVEAGNPKANRFPGCYSQLGIGNRGYKVWTIFRWR